MGKVSGPILDRIDLCVELQPVVYENFRSRRRAEDSGTIRRRVEKARVRQRERFGEDSCRFNGEIEASAIEKYCPLGAEEQKCMEQMYDALGLSARSYHRILKVARTIADLEGDDDINVGHLMEASFYRPSLEYWGR